MKDWINKITKKNKKTGKRTEIENKTDKILTDKEKEIILKTLENLKENMIQIQKAVLNNEEDKKKLINALITIQELIDIEDDKTGKPYTKQDYEKMTSSELAVLTHDALEYALEQFKNKGE